MFSGYKRTGSIPSAASNEDQILVVVKPVHVVRQDRTDYILEAVSADQIVYY